MKFRVETITGKRQVKVPEGWQIEQIVTNDKGEFKVLMSDNIHHPHKQKDAAIGFQVYTDD